MYDNRRDQLLAAVEREFIGPDPIDWEDSLQKNGEEILTGDPPHTRYLAGILYPTAVIHNDADENDTDTSEDAAPTEGTNQQVDFFDESDRFSRDEAMEEAEELINRSNAYHQSAMSLTVAIKDGDAVSVRVDGATYSTIKATDAKTDKEIRRYVRTPLVWTNADLPLNLPTTSKMLVTEHADDKDLLFHITWRYRKGNCTIYTFTIENHKASTQSFVSDDDLYFQVSFSLTSVLGFAPLPEPHRTNVNDEDYLSNLLLYRNIHNYAIGHGCAADWEDSENVSWISTAVFPTYEVKPILPTAIKGVSLSMYKLSQQDTFDDSIAELNTLCDRYALWIDQLEIRKATLDPSMINTADRHISNCRKCLARMQNGIRILKDNAAIRTAFQYMNLAMLEQQLHYNLPAQRWVETETGLVLENPIRVLPDAHDPNTWYDPEHHVYGKWRPFQLAFVLMNLQSMADHECDERKIVDLIWFPTGGGKTEAYLGLSAYTIFLRRMLNHDDNGTAILMRYTLRLLTAQQYERASAMICACEHIRSKHEDLFGTNRISIGLWVGGDTTPNKRSDAVKAYNDLKNGKESLNPFVMLKCPWCGAQMGPIQLKNGTIRLPGYQKVPGPHRKEMFLFQCSNKAFDCEFSRTRTPLPLYIVDEDIYEKCPTLLLGTVDKFAMLPFRPAAQRLFGYVNGVKKSSPDLIIQDELHLISGPLGSMVGHYETLISDLCKTRLSDGTVLQPKVIASTATISRAKEQCHALYACGKENVFQFPPSGLDAGDSFFAYEDKDKNGRRYVGILATGSSDATVGIRLITSLLYGAKDMTVEQESDRDPYWTNIGYFNSVRELGLASSWIHADIDQHLDVMYKRQHLEKRLEREEYQCTRRYIHRDEELTSRIAGDKVTASLANLGVRYSEEQRPLKYKGERAIDICLATNMIQVGLDVPRLGLMTVMGQPKTTSEYIQATSRVGRDINHAPGIVFVVYRPGRPRDKSHYEQFRNYHSKLYCSVEPTSVTPFSSPVRSRALAAVAFGMMRLENTDTYNADPPKMPDESLLTHVKETIRERVDAIDGEETSDTMAYMEQIMMNWEHWRPQVWSPIYTREMAYANDVPLIYPAGTQPNAFWENHSTEAPTSMRNVDAACEAAVPNSYFAREDE